MLHERPGSCRTCQKLLHPLPITSWVEADSSERRPIHQSRCREILSVSWILTMPTQLRISTWANTTSRQTCKRNRRTCSRRLIDEVQHHHVTFRDVSTTEVLGSCLRVYMHHSCIQFPFSYQDITVSSHHWKACSPQEPQGLLELMLGSHRAWR